MAQTDKQQQLALMQQMVAQRSWVKTPWNYTKLSGGMSLIQQQALLMVSEHLQGYIRKFYELKLDKARNTPKSLFTEHVLREGIPPFRIYLQDLGIEPSNYGAARKAIDEINLQVEYTVTDEQGQPTDKTELANVFTTFGFEKTGDYYHYTNKEGKADYTKMQQPYIDVKINPDVAIWAFNMQDGYVNHLKMIAMYSTKRSTPRIYLMLMKRMRKEQTAADIRIPFGELKEYLGIAPNAYPMFRSFKQKVLDAVQQDLQRMAREVPPQTDITFTYDLCYPGRRKMGDPEAILFHVERTSLGMAYGIVVSKARLPIEPDMFATDPQQQPNCDTFRTMIRNIGHEVTKDQAARFRQMGFVKYEDGQLFLTLPDGEAYKWVESESVLRYLRAKLRQHFPDFREVFYKVLG